MAECQVCGSQTAGSRMCDKHVRQFRDDLVALSRLLPSLRLVARKQANVTGRQSGSHGARSVAPIPINVGAFELVSAIDTYAVNLADAIGLRHLRMPAEDLLKGAASHAGMLMRRADALTCFRIASRSLSKVRRQLTPPVDLINIGSCLACGGDLWASDDDVAADWMPCAACGSTVQVRAVQQTRMLRLATYGAQGTASAICDLLGACGVWVMRKTVNQWHSRKRIHSVGVQDGKPVFRLWDVWQRAAASGPRAPDAIRALRLARALRHQ